MRLGMHISIAGCVALAVERATSLGCEAFQIFVSNPRGWACAPLPEADVQAFRRSREQRKLGPVVVHLSYLPNPATADPELAQKSATALSIQYENAARIGADAFVLHPGSATDGNRTEGIKRAAAMLRKVLQDIPHGPALCLENMAGGGNQLGGTPEELAEIDRQIKFPERVGVCLDTAHAMAAGHDIVRPGGMQSMRKRFHDAFGRHPIRVLHANDLRSKPGSKQDRHEHIGMGAIGEEGFRRIFHTPGFRRLTVILETPVDETRDDACNLRIARTLAH